ncbi:type II secretion system minor pseudopilin GspI [Vibrio sonorensis]|uniref:type II secretion system minor pseudopilin GspI n=1 Tax=Vibrio sonorensis TaxID=1004316 RepID=UPI0008DA3726|nr:type II secretion system minor pseudopilin GspI [Vibrio sonorensis]
MKRVKKGFTLIEVMFALFIFSIAAVATIRSVTQHINTLSFLEEKTFASMVADNQLALVHLKGSVAKRNGMEEMAGRKWYWTVVPVETVGDLLQGFDVSVATSADSSPVITVRSYVGK